MTPVARSLTTERTRLRQPVAADLPAYRAHYSSARSIYQGGPYSATNCFEKLATMIGHWDIRGFGRYVIEVDGHAVGHVGPLQIDDDSIPELTWSLWTDAAEGKGYATEATIGAARHLLHDCDWPLLAILILPDNAKSLRVADRLGARLTDTPAPDWYAGARVYHLDKAALA